MQTLSSCISKEPFLKIGLGEAPVLNYNIPQETCFNVYGRIPLNISQKYFTPESFKIPQNNFWDKLKSKKEKDIRKELSEIFINGSSSGILGTKLNGIKNKIAIDTSTLGLEQIKVNTKSKASTKTTTVASPEVKTIVTKEIQYTDLLTERIVNGFMPLAYKSFSGEDRIHYVPRPEKPSPGLFCIETYSVCSYLGDYGAGKTLNILSLLPGEKTQITVKTYLDKETTNTSSQNILDSFSSSSADEYEHLLKDETGTSETNSTSVGLSLDISGTIKDITVGLGLTADHTHETTNNVSAIDQTTEKHIQSTNQSRDVTVNVTSSESVKSGTETSIVRTIENINKSRVLNFAFRQLLQEYITLVSLTNVKILYTNGYPESTVIMNIFELDKKLKGIIADDKIQEVKNTIIKKYCTVYNYEGEPKAFLEKVIQDYKDCDCGNFSDTLEFCRVNKKLIDEAKGLSVNGVILSVKTHALKTPAIICDAILGQGEALDCYNMELQKAAVDVAKLENLKSKMALDIIDSIAGGEQKAKAYKELFNAPCCDDAKTTEE